MKIKTVIVLIGCFSITGSLTAAVLNGGSYFNGNGTLPDTIILDASSNPLSTGFYAVGYFSLTNTDIDLLVSTNSVASLASAFTTIASDNFVNGLPDVIGASALPGLSAVSNGDFDPTGGIGRTFYTFMTDAASLGTSDSYALYRHTTQVISADPLNPPPNEYNAYIQDGTLIAGALGSVLYDFGNGAIATQSIQLTVPEPSSLLLSAVGVLALLRRKR